MLINLMQKRLQDVYKLMHYYLENCIRNPMGNCCYLTLRIVCLFSVFPPCTAWDFPFAFCRDVTFCNFEPFMLLFSSFWHFDSFTIFHNYCTTSKISFEIVISVVRRFDSASSPLAKLTCYIMCSKQEWYRNQGMNKIQIKPMFSWISFLVAFIQVFLGDNACTLHDTYHRKPEESDESSSSSS